MYVCICYALQEYEKCQQKKDKYATRERTGPNVVKLENVCGFILHHKVKCTHPAAAAAAATTTTATTTTTTTTFVFCLTSLLF